MGGRSEPSRQRVTATGETCRRARGAPGPAPCPAPWPDRHALLADLLHQVRAHRVRHRVRQLALRPEPLLVDLEVLAALETRLEAGVHGGLELGVALAHGHAVGL